MLAGQRLSASVLSVGIVAPPISTSVAGTPSSGTTEVFDVVLGYYQATLIAGHRYEVRMNGLVGNGTTPDVYQVQIRDSGSTSNPTSSSTLVAQGQWFCPATGSGGRQSIPLAGTFLASSGGVHTFGMSSMRLSGTVAFTPEAPPGGGVRELFVVDLGGN
jgi:hypothetical protein